MSEQTIKVNLLDGSIVTMNTEERVISYQLAEQMIPLTTDADSVFDDVLAALEEAQQQNKELQEGNRSACESRDMAYRSRDEAIVTSNQHYKQAFFLNEKLTEAQQAFLVQEDTIKFLDQKLTEAQQTIARQREALEQIMNVTGADYEESFEKAVHIAFSSLGGYIQP